MSPRRRRSRDTPATVDVARARICTIRIAPRVTAWMRAVKTVPTFAESRPPWVMRRWKTSSAEGFRAPRWRGSYTISDAAAANIVAYLRTLATSVDDSGTSSGNPQKGEALFKSSGCSACHMIAGEGGSIGPELTRIGSMRGTREPEAKTARSRRESAQHGWRGNFRQQLDRICDVPCG